MTDKLTTEDKQRIEQAAKLSWKNTITAFEDSDEISFWEGYLTGAEYATLFERQQQKTLFENQAIAWEDKVKDKNDEIESLKAKLKQWDLDALEAQGGIEEDSQTIKRQINEIAEWKEIYQRLESNFLKLTTENNELEAERSELRNKVIEECVEKVRYSYNLSLGATDTVVELLNSLKTK